MAGYLVSGDDLQRFNEASRRVRAGEFENVDRSGSGGQGGIAPTRMLQTCANGSEAYPSATGSGPNGSPPTGGQFAFYWAQFVTMTLSATPTDQGLQTISYIPTGEPLQLLCVLGTAAVAQGTIFLAQGLGGLWFTVPAGNDLVPFRNDDGATVPANGVICSYLTSYPASCPGFGDAVNTNWPGWGTQFPGICASRVNYYQSYLMGWAGGYFINAGAAVATQAGGTCTPATHKPVMALYRDDTGASTTSPLPGEIWGPAPGSSTFALYRGLPGFMVVGPVDTTNKLAGVIACHEASCWCAAKEAWHYGASFLPRYDRQCWVTCYPTTGPSGGQYDGSSRSPHIELLLNLRRGALYKDPNIVAGNTLVYRATSAQYGALAGGGGGSAPYFEPAGCDYLDEPVGTVKPFATALPTGIQGWGVMNATLNASGLGGSGIDGTSYQRILRPGTPGNTGGTWNHTHPLTSQQTVNENFQYGNFGYTPDTAADSGTAPVAYAEIGGWLERLNNGQH